MGHVRAVIRVIGNDLQFNPGMYYLFVFLQTAIMSIIVIEAKQSFLLINCITNDSIFSALAVVIKSFNGQQSKLYSRDMIDRYIYYGILNVLDIIILLVLWGRFYWTWHFLVCLTTSPGIFNCIVEFDGIKPLVAYIRAQIDELQRFLICSIAAYCFNKSFKNLFRNRRKLTGVHWKDIYEGWSQVKLERYKIFLKTFAIATIINYLEKAGGFVRVFPWVIDILYRYGAIVHTEEVVDDPGGQYTTSKDKIFAIVRSKEWSKLHNPHVLNALIDVYRESPSGSMLRKIKQFVNLFGKRFGRFIAWYSIISVFNITGFVVLASILMSRNESKINIMIKIAGGLLGMYCADEILSAFICEFGLYLNTKLVRWIVNSIWNKIQTKLYRNYNNTYNIHIISCILAFGLFEVNFLQILTLVAFMKNKYIVLLFIFIGWISNYNILHLIALGCILYIGINLAHMNNVKPTLKAEIVDDYNPILRRRLRLDPMEESKHFGGYVVHDEPCEKIDDFVEM